MPNRIRLLEDAVANQIAAGEVIERPASAVKELIENSLDAGAVRIEVEIEQGGRQLVRVTDNGCGMSRDDALLCIERHATSKVREAGDLFAVRTFGFRGEALPSIASVSEFRLRTAEPGAVGGTEIIVRGGRVESVRDVGAPPGTQIEARRLFYNLPGRRKFLRSAGTESGHVEHLLRVYAAANPAVAWRFIEDGRCVQELPATESHARRVRELFGDPFAEALMPVEGSGGAGRIRGWVGRPGVNRATRSEELWFVNGRPVDSRTLYHAIREAYRPALPRGRHPLALLFVEIDPARIDVNVHPAKREVRFRDPDAVRDLVASAVANALAGQTTPSLPDAPACGPRVPAPPSGATQPPTPPHAHAAAGPSPWFALTAPAAPRQIAVETPLPLPLPAAAPPPPGDTTPAASQPDRLRVLAVVRGAFVVAESPQGLVLLDHRAARERVLFERLLKQRLDGAVASQHLLSPETLELGPREAALLRRTVPALRAAGFEIQDFGRNSFKIEAVPPFLAPSAAPALVRNVIADLERSGSASARRTVEEDDVVRSVCHRAAPPQSPLPLPEIELLLDDLLRCDLPYTCPRGRPTMILISDRELLRRFGRA